LFLAMLLSLYSVKKVQETSLHTYESSHYGKCGQKSRGKHTPIINYTLKSEVGIMLHLYIAMLRLLHNVSTE